MMPEAYAAWMMSLLARLDCAAQLVGKRCESPLVRIAGIRRRRFAQARGSFRHERHADPLLLWFDAHDLECGGDPRRNEARPVFAASGRWERRRVRQCFDSRFEFDEGAELRDSR